jgi:hypothetical protein
MYSVYGYTGPTGYTGHTGDTGPTGFLITPRGLWVAETSYILNDVVLDTIDNNAYICIQAGTGEQPSTSTAYWTLYSVYGYTGPTGYTGNTGMTGPTGFVITPRGLWVAETSYVLNDVVLDTIDNNAYICIQAGTGEQPSTATAYWTLYSVYGYTGPTGPTGNTGMTGPPGLAITPRGPWGFETPYVVNDVVLYEFDGNTNAYICIGNNSGSSPFSYPEFWTLYSVYGYTGPTGFTGPVGATGYTGPTGPILSNYTPTTPADWTGSAPTTIQAALDRLAAGLVALSLYP